MSERRVFSVLIAILTLCGGLAASPRAEAARRVALVVGINVYAAPKADAARPESDQVVIPRLTKAVPDSISIEGVLRDSLGFDAVERLENPGYGALTDAWRRLLDKIDDGTLVFFYFAGHGIEIEGQNYLIAADAPFRLTDAKPTKESSISLRLLLEDLGRKQKEKSGVTGVFVIDACRDNPYIELLKAGGTAVRSGYSEYLAPVRGLPERVFVMYSAGVGQEANDGTASMANSVYTTKLLPLLTQQGGAAAPSLADMAQDLRYSVYLAAKDVINKRTGRPHHQTPAYYDQLLTRHSLLGGRGAPPRTSAVAGAAGDSRALEDGEITLDCADCPELVQLPSGAFTMGSEDEGLPSSERPAHRVEIRRPFAIGRYEVTNREWNACVTDKGCSGARDLAREPGKDRGPVTRVSWHDAKAYVTWLSAKTGRTYRLPTEAEWEYAARAGLTGAYPFDTSEPDSLCQHANGADRLVDSLFYSSSCSDGTGREPAATGSYPPNPWGVFDMLGNVWEWVGDCWSPSYDGAPGDGTARTPAEGACDTPVARGGSWRTGPTYLRPAARNAFPADLARQTVGFRVVRVSE